MRKKGIFMATTEIAAEKTAGQIMEVLSKYSVSRIQTTYKDGKMAGLDFAIEHAGTEIYYSLPARTDRMLELIKERRPDHCPRTPEQARRVAWRQMLRWVEAQLALVDSSMVELHEIFLPFLLVRPGQTLFEKFQEDGFKQLTHADPGQSA